jgi:cytochrome c oxidase subunit IV
MSSSDTTHADESHEHGHEEHTHHPLPLPAYLAVFATLIFMTAVTVGASYVDFGAANTAIAVIIATIKASLVALFFMDLARDKRFNGLIFVSGLIFLSFLFIFTMTDTGTRGMVDDINGTKVPSPYDSAMAAPPPGGAHGAAHGAASAHPAEAPAHH